LQRGEGFPVDPHPSLVQALASALGGGFEGEKPGRPSRDGVFPDEPVDIGPVEGEIEGEGHDLLGLDQGKLGKAFPGDSVPVDRVGELFPLERVPPLPVVAAFDGDIHGRARLGQLEVEVHAAPGDPALECVVLLPLDFLVAREDLLGGRRPSGFHLELLGGKFHPPGELPDEDRDDRFPVDLQANERLPLAGRDRGRQLKAPGRIEKACLSDPRQLERDPGVRPFGEACSRKIDEEEAPAARPIEELGEKPRTGKGPPARVQEGGGGNRGGLESLGEESAERPSPADHELARRRPGGTLHPDETRHRPEGSGSGGERGSFAVFLEADPQLRCRRVEGNLREEVEDGPGHRLGRDVPVEPHR